MNSKTSLREIIFGLEDGIVSTLGVIVGIAAGTNSRFVVILSGLIIIFVESLSMAAGTYLSNKSELQLHLSQKHHFFWQSLTHQHNPKKPLIDSLYMGVAYILGGSAALISFTFLPPLVAIAPAIAISFSLLFLVGVIKGNITKVSLLQSGFEMMLISALAALVGFIVGKTVPIILPLPL